jgi:hypothetical protein
MSHSGNAIRMSWRERLALVWWLLVVPGLFVAVPVIDRYNRKPGADTAEGREDGPRQGSVQTGGHLRSLWASAASLCDGRKLSNVPGSEARDGTPDLYR